MIAGRSPQIAVVDEDGGVTRDNIVRVGVLRWSGSRQPLVQRPDLRVRPRHHNGESDAGADDGNRDGNLGDRPGVFSRLSDADRYSWP